MSPGNEPECNERRPRMMLRRLGIIAPLAVLVAVLVHLALFGTQHAPGAEHAGRLYSSLAAALSLAALGTVLCAALGLRRCRRERRVAGAHRLFFPLELAAGATLAFALIEGGEGHSPLVYGGWQFAATAAAAYAVAVLARYVAQVLARSGDAFAAFASTRAHAPVAFLFVRALRSAIAYGAVRPNACRGRAPPLFS